MFASTLLRSRSLISQPASRTFSSIKHIGVIGAGQMGTGIGIVASRIAGLNVTMVDPTETSLNKSRDFTNNWCQKEIAKERMT